MTEQYSLTLFKNRFDVKTNKSMSFDTFDDFSSFLRKISKVKYKDKKDAPLISPAVYEKGTTRKNINVTCWGMWSAIDIDNLDGVSSTNLEEYLNGTFSTYDCDVYSTASSNRSNPKFRVAFRLSRSVQSNDIPKFWFAINSRFHGVVDRQTKDLSRMFYVPGNFSQFNPNVYSFYHVYRNGTCVDVDSIIEQYPMPVQSTNLFDRLPPHIQQEIINQKKSALDNFGYKWNSYKDCPFWPQKLELEYRAITGSGWYIKLYEIMVAVAGRAISKKYPISAFEIAQLCQEFDADTGGWYKNRPLIKEAERALEFVYKNSYMET